MDTESGCLPLCEAQKTAISIRRICIGLGRTKVEPQVKVGSDSQVRVPVNRDESTAPISITKIIFDINSCSTNTTSYVIYFLNLSDGTFRRMESSPVGTNTFILADSVTNTTIFSAQNRSGQVLTNSQNNEMIHLALDFYQPERFLQRPDYYQLETSVTPRAVQ